MNRADDNPDRKFATGRADDEEARRLRDLLKSSPIADVTDSMRMRIGKVIADAVSNENKQ